MSIEVAYLIQATHRGTILPWAMASSQLKMQSRFMWNSWDVISSRYQMNTIQAAPNAGNTPWDNPPLGFLSQLNCRHRLMFHFYAGHYLNTHLQFQLQSKLILTMLLLWRGELRQISPGCPIGFYQAQFTSLCQCLFSSELIQYLAWFCND